MPSESSGNGCPSLTPHSILFPQIQCFLDARKIQLYFQISSPRYSIPTKLPNTTSVQSVPIGCLCNQRKPMLPIVPLLLQSPLLKLTWHTDIEEEQFAPILILKLPREELDVLVADTTLLAPPSCFLINLNYAHLLHHHVGGRSILS